MNVRTIVLRGWCLVLALVAFACSDARTSGGLAGRADGIGSASQALTTLDTSPSTLGVSSFGPSNTPTFGQVFVAPVGDTVLRSFAFQAASMPPSARFRGHVYAWDGNKATGPSLYTSATTGTTSTSPEFVSFDVGAVGLVGGAQYIFIVSSSGVSGSGSGTVSATMTPKLPASGFVFSLSDDMGRWATDASTWVKSVMNSYDLTFRATFDAPQPSSVALSSSVSPSVFGQSVQLTASVTSTPAATGLVTFKDGTTTIGLGTLNSAGQAFLTISNLSVGSHALTAEFASPDGAFLPSTSPVLTQNVSPASTTTVVGSSSNPSAILQNITLSATVATSVPGSGTPSGTVTFFDGTTSLGSAAADGSGVARIMTSGLGTGSHGIRAEYGGDTNHLASSSNTFTQVVVPDATTVAVSASANPTSYGTSVTFTVTVSTTGAGGIPTGTVTLREGSTILGSGTLNGAGVTAIATAVLVGGTHTIVADYGGDTNHDPASGSVIQTVALASSSTSLVSLTNPSVFGQAVQLSATVTGVSGGATPTGTVTFLDGTTAIGFGVLNGAGQATFSTSALSASAHTLTARYGADSNYVSSDSPPLSQQVNRAGTTTSLASSANPSALGASVTFTANVSATAPGSGVPVGNVTFRDGATVLGTVATDASGQATFTTSALILGGHSIRASYGGSSSFNASNSAFLTQEISVRPVTVTVTSSGTPSAYGSSVTFEATVASGGATPTGTVTFTEGVILLGTTTLDGSGKGSIAVGTLSGGSHSITATYSGDAEHAGGSSGAFVQVVSRAPTASVITSSVNPSVSGQSVVFTATVTSPVSGSITGTVTFSDGSTILGARALDASGVATFTTSQLSVGAHSIVASFDGDTNFGASTSMAYVQTVGKASSRVVLSSSASPVNGGDTVTYTASVASVLPGSGVPSGTVTFTDTFGGSTTTLGTGTVDSLGVASYVAMPDSGTHVIGARYEGDASFLASDATTITQEVVANASTVALVLSPTPSTFGDTVTWSVTVTGSSPSGALTFKDGTTVLGTGTLDSSSAATFTTSALGGGVHTLVVEYGGDTANAAGTRSVQHTVQRAPTTTTVASAPNPSTFGSAVTVTAEVSSAVLGLTGQVEIFDGMLSLGTAALASGRATLTTSTLTVGGHALSVRYEGTSDFAPSTSMATTQQVDDAVDGGVTDGGTVDGGSSDGGISDGGSTDGGTLDGSVVLPDATVPDAGDGGRTDAGSDAGDTGRTDGGADASSGDAGRDSAAPNDAAVVSDADAPRPDSGVIVVDASASDSGIPNGSGVEGAGGCNCRVQGTTLSGNDPMFASAGVVFGLAVMARRRRRAA